MVSAKMGNRTVERLEEYAEREGISRSQATERMAKQGLDVEESDMRLVPIKTDGGTQIENQLKSVESELNNQSKKIDTQQQYQQYLSMAIVMSIIWIGVQAGEGLSIAMTIATGIPLIAFIGFLVYQTRQR